MLNNAFAEIDDVERFPILNIDDLMDDCLSQNIPTCYDEINVNEIETYQLYRHSLETTENGKSKRCDIHSSYMAIFNSFI